MSEAEFIASLRALATHPGARGLTDDAAVLEIGGRSLMLTKDMIVEGVHYLPDDPPADVAWKLLAVNLSDLAAKGARPMGVLLGYTLGDGDWDRAFADGLATALSGFGVPLLGGDTVSAPEGAPRTLSLTALGTVDGSVPSRGGAVAGDHLWVSGSVGDAGAGLRMLSGELPPSDALIRRYRTPRPRLEAGQALATLVSAMMDVSDGLLIDAARMAKASGVAFAIDIDSVPLSEDYVRALGEGRDARLRAATAGDDYELLFTASPGLASDILSLSERLSLPLSRIGEANAGIGLSLRDHAGEVPLPTRLGYSHARR